MNNNMCAPLGVPQYLYWNQPQQYDIVKVNGENGANAFKMGPNSKILLLDENEPIIWFVQTDGAGYKTITPYDVTPHKTQQPVDLNSLEARIASLEERLNAKSNSGTGSKKRQSNAATATTVVEE